MGENEKEKCRALWHSVHEGLMSKFVKKIDFYYQKWFQSPAGKSYREEVVILKYYRSSLNPLTFPCRKRKIPNGPFRFESFIGHKDATGQQHPGVEEWGVAVVYDIFSCLSHVADVGVVDVIVCYSPLLTARFPRTIL